MRATFPAYLHFIVKILFATDNEASHYTTSWLFTHPSTGLDKPLEVQEFEVSRISKQPAHGDKVVSPTHRPHLSPRHIPPIQFC